MKQFGIHINSLKPIFLTLAIITSIHVFGQNNQINSMLLIPETEFTMGKNTPYPSDWSPAHTVHVDSFLIDKYEVTNKEYLAFCQATGNPLPEFWGMKEFKSGPEFPEFPVVGVSLFDAEKYAKWAGKRLPTEAEWECAARGGLVDKNFPLGDQVDSTLVNFGSKKRGVVKVGSYKPNGYGICDMSGNVWEWVSDNYGSEYYKNSPIDNPKGPETARFKVIRGGSFHSGAMCVQTYFRNGLSGSWVDMAVGFRCAKSIE